MPKAGQRKAESMQVFVEVTVDVPESMTTMLASEATGREVADAIERRLVDRFVVAPAQAGADQYPVIVTGIVVTGVRP